MDIADRFRDWLTTLDRDHRALWEQGAAAERERVRKEWASLARGWKEQAVNVMGGGYADAYADRLLAALDRICPEEK